MHQPSGIGISNQDVAGIELGGDLADALDVDSRISAHLELEAAIALGAVIGDSSGHCVGRILRDRAVKNIIVAVAAAQQHPDRLAGRLSQDVPAGHVERRLHVGMALEGRIHQAVQAAELTRVFAEQMRPELANSRPRALGISRQVKRSEGANLAMARQAIVGLDRHDRAVEDRHGFST